MEASAKSDAIEPTPEHSATGSEVEVEVSTIEIDEDHFGAAVASVEERIYLSDIIVRATLVSAAGGVLRFRAVEYLKGTGAEEFSVSASTESRDTQWDGQEAVLFLSLPESGSKSGSGGGASSEFEFADTTEFDYRPLNSVTASVYAGDLPEGYTIDSQNPVWLPLQTGSGSGAGGHSDFVAATASVLGVSSPTVSLADLRSKIAWVEGGAGIEGYDECIRESLDYIRFYRDHEAYDGTPFRLGQTEAQIVSGAGRGTEVGAGTYGTYRWPAHSKVWLTGGDAALFSAQIFDGDGDPATGFRTIFTTARPLPAGTYRTIYRRQHHQYQPCDYMTPYSRLEWVVTVTAPNGTVHEALFDPADLSPGTGFSSSAGTLDPAGFSFGATSTTVTGLKWAAGSVVLTLSPHVSLAGQAVDFIGLDGTVSLSLGVAAATVDSAAGTLTWPVAAQPWKAGDKLMVRVRAAPPAPTGLTATAGNASVTLAWNDPSNTTITGYEYQMRWTGVGWQDWVAVPSSGASTTSYAVTGLTNGTEYRFKVRAVNAAGAGRAGPSADPWYIAATPQVPPPAAPAGLTATSGNASVTLAWGDPANTTITRYEYQMRWTGVGWQDWVAIPNSGATTLSYAITGLTNGTEYRFKVRAVNAAGAGRAGPSADPWYVSATPQVPPPAAPTGLTALAADASVALAWDDPLNTTITGYEYQMRWTGVDWQDWVAVPNSDASTTSYAVTGLTNGTEYRFKVRAISAGGAGRAAPSARPGYVSATPQAPKG